MHLTMGRRSANWSHAAHRAAMPAAVGRWTACIPAAPRLRDIGGDARVDCSNWRATTAAAGIRFRQHAHIASADAHRNGVIGRCGGAALAGVISTETKFNQTTLPTRTSSC